MITEVKNTVPWTYAISDHNSKEIVRTFYEKELRKANQGKLRIEKVIKRKGDKLYVKWKKIVHLIVGLIKKILLYKNESFSTLWS